MAHLLGKGGTDFLDTFVGQRRQTLVGQRFHTCVGQRWPLLWDNGIPETVALLLLKKSERIKVNFLVNSLLL